MPTTAEPIPALSLRLKEPLEAVVAPGQQERARRLAQAAQYAGLGVFVLALLVRLGVLLGFSGSPHFGVQGGDMRFYHDWALRIMSGQWTDHHAFYGLPGYAYFLAAIYKVVGVHPGFVLTLQAVVDAATALLVFQMTRSLVSKPSIVPVNPWPAIAWAGLAALGWMLFVPAQAFSAILMPTVLAAACYWFCVRQAMEGGRHWLALGALVGVMAMMVATVLFAVPLLLASIVRAKSRRVLAAALLLLGVGLGTAPAWMHNYFVAREPVFLSAHGGINFWIGNAPGANGYPKIPGQLRSGQQELLDDSIAIAEQQSGGKLSRAEVSHYWSTKAWGYIRQQPLAWAELLAIKVRNFWNAFVYDDVTIIPLLREEGVLLPGIGFGLVASLGLAGLCVALREKQRARWVAAAVLLHLLALMPVFVTERYRLAAVPGLLVLGVYFLARLGEYAGARHWRSLAACVGLVALTTTLVHLPVQAGLLESMEPYNLAISELEANQLDRAERHLQTAQKLAPGNPSLLFALGNLALKRGDLPKAKAFYRQSLDRDPRNADAFANLGVIALTEKRPEIAVKFFRAALSLQPGDTQTAELLARALKESGAR